ncbi:MAG: 23S rRNA (uracil-5-)-methyltransferase RumA, partial [Lachnospiraceae bacterium]|nr:23S rRNA (uracil-5-)-methyltransferase RumA [Lachnospiraceae bacterium]
MKKGQIYEGLVEKVIFRDKGLVSCEGETCVVKACLPGQKIKFIVTKKRNGKAEGRLLEVIEKSPMETGRTCSLFGVCGGCNYLSLSYDNELELKKDQVKTLLDNVPGIDKNPYVFEGIKGSPVVYGYRNKMEFSFGDSVKG